MIRYEEMTTSHLFLRYIIPQMIGLVFNSVYLIVDGIFIGQRLGSAALAAAGVAVPVVEITIALSMLLAVGTGIIISQRMGAGDAKGARQAFNLSVALTLGISVAVMVLGVAFATPLARMLGADDSLLADTSTYLRYFLGFCPALIGSFALSTYVRNDGNPKLAMWALTIGSLSNIFLDWLFMYPLNMGMAGAALATGLGPVFSVLLMLPHFLRKKGQLWFEKPKVCVKTVRHIFTGGLPAFIAEFSIGFTTLLYNLAIVRQGLGEDGLAAYVVIGYAALICLTAFLGTGQGIQPAVSYFAGAGYKKRIQQLARVTFWFSLAMAGAMYAALFFGGQLFFGIFMPQGGALLAMTTQASHLYFLLLPFAAINILGIAVLQSMEQTGEAVVLSLMRSTLPLMILLAVLPLIFGLNGMWLAAAVAEAATVVLTLVLVRRAFYKSSKHSQKQQASRMQRTAQSRS